MIFKYARPFTRYLRSENAVSAFGNNEYVLEVVYLDWTIVPARRRVTLGVPFLFTDGAPHRIVPHMEKFFQRMFTALRCRGLVAPRVEPLVEKCT